jgi:homoserine kinase
VTVVPATFDGVGVQVPGSTSNLGAGFDALGLALQLYLRARIVTTAARADGSLRFRFTPSAPDGENLIARALRAATERTGASLPSLDVEVASDIPLKAGLGSSAAAIVAGLRLFESIAGELPEQLLLDLAAELEGHPDNTSASLLGGLTVSCQSGSRVVALAAPWPVAIRVVVATPAVTVATHVARAVLPATVAHADAVYNVQRSTLLVQALALGRTEVIREALRDRLHQPYRAALVPGLSRALTLESPGLLGVFLSGAGPSIAALVEGETTAVERLFTAMYADEGVPCTVRTVPVHQPLARSAGLKPVGHH